MKHTFGLVFLILSLSLTTSQAREPLVLSDILETSQASVVSEQNVYWTQLLNHDALSPIHQLEQRVTARLQEVEMLIGEIRAEAEDFGIPVDESKLIFPVVYGEVGVRTQFYREKIGEARSLVMNGAPLVINFNQVETERELSRSQAGYPVSTPHSNYQYRCTSGGFMTTAQDPDLRGFQRNPSMLNDFSQWISRACSTPSEVSLNLDGKKLNFTCDGKKASDENTKRAVAKMIMCDPLLYGFIPRAPGTGENRMAACHYPEQQYIGRSFTYSDNISSPNKGNPSGFNSNCDLIAQTQISPQVSRPEHLADADGSLLIAARLALENPQLFRQKKHRVQSQCNLENARFIETDHCHNLIHRISLIEGLMERIKTQSGPGANPATIFEEDTSRL